MRGQSRQQQPLAGEGGRGLRPKGFLSSRQGHQELAAAAARRLQPLLLLLLPGMSTGTGGPAGRHLLPPVPQPLGRRSSLLQMTTLMTTVTTCF